MKATTEFVTRIAPDGLFIKIVLSPDHNVYQYQHKDINFFIHRDYWNGSWNVIESCTGSSIVTDYYTKKECLIDAFMHIDIILDIDKVIEHHIELTRSARIVNMDEYIAME